jgi:hypothetical protein
MSSIAHPSGCDLSSNTHYFFILLIPVLDGAECQRTTECVANLVDERVNFGSVMAGPIFGVL